MPYVKLPKNVRFSPPRNAGEQKDAFDIIVDGNTIHTFEYSTTQIKGNSSEEFIIAQAHVDAKDWLRNNGHLPAGE